MLRRSRYPSNLQLLSLRLQPKQGQSNEGRMEGRTMRDTQAPTPSRSSPELPAEQGRTGGGHARGSDLEEAVQALARPVRIRYVNRPRQPRK